MLFRSASGKDVKARVIKNYDGNDIELSPGIISSVETFPELKAHKGEGFMVLLYFVYRPVMKASASPVSTIIIPK